jgi:hypothetical protein
VSKKCPTKVAKVRRMTPYTFKWEVLAGEVARAFAPAIRPCKDCGYPVITGYVCERCDPRAARESAQ